MSKKPTVLMILDGYGLNERHDAKRCIRSEHTCHGQADG